MAKTQPKPPPPREYSREEQAVRVLERCRGMARAQAQAYCDTLTAQELDAVASYHALLDLPPQKPPLPIGALLVSLIDLIDDRRQADGSGPDVSPENVPFPVAEAATDVAHSPDGFPDLDG